MDSIRSSGIFVEPSTGTGSRYAVAGVESAFAEADASTELVTLRCYAVSGKDHPLAHLGAELADISSGRVTIRLPYRNELTQQDGFFHAGASSAIADLQE